MLGGAEGITDLERARRFYVRVRQSFFGLGVQRQNKGWHMSKQHVNAQGGETVSRWKNGVEKLHEVAQEIRRNFQIINSDFSAAIDRLDFPGAFFYCDPPYPWKAAGVNTRVETTCSTLRMQITNGWLGNFIK